MVNTSDLSIQVRPMLLSDLDDIFSIDEKIRAGIAGQFITYEDISTKQIFGMDVSEDNPTKSPSIAEAAELINFGFVAEVEGRICCFILDRQSSIGEDTAEFGEIVFLGVLPDYWRKGVATSLLDSLCKKFQSSGINTIATGVVRHDKAIVTFFECMGFSRGPLLSYIKTL